MSALILTKLVFSSLLSERNTQHIQMCGYMRTVSTLCVWFQLSSEATRSPISTTCVCVCACVSVCLYSTSKEKSPLIAVGGLVGRDLQAMGRSPQGQLLALTIALSLQQLLENKLFKKTKDRCLISVKKFCT